MINFISGQTMLGRITMISFNGCFLSTNHQRIIFDYRKDFWETPNHNWLRITRVLKSLNLCGLHDKTQEFWAFLKDTPVTDGTKAYWEIAAKI